MSATTDASVMLIAVTAPAAAHVIDTKASEKVAMREDV